MGGAEKTAEKVSKQDKIVREKWNFDAKPLSLSITKSANVLKKKCKGDYILYLQASEVIHEDSAEEIRRLPEEYPFADLFNLPFINIYGRDMIQYKQYRARLAKNVPYINVITDGYSLGYSYKNYGNRLSIIIYFLIYHFLHNFNTSELKKLFFILYMSFKNIGVGDNPYTPQIILPRPVYRYSATKPEFVLKKIDKNLMFDFTNNKDREDAKNFQEQVLKIYKNDKKNFWKKVRKLFLASPLWSKPITFMGEIQTFRIISIKEQPKLMQNLFKNS